MTKRKISAGIAAVALATLGSPATAQDFDWNVKANRIKIAGALNNWADFCSGMFGFERVPKKANEVLEGKINAHLLLSSMPSVEVARWGAWLPYMNSDSDVAQPSITRAGDALLAARADPSSMVAAEKLYTDTLRGYFRTILGKCSEGAGEPFIAEQFYSGAGDFEKSMAQVRTDFAEGVKELDKPEPKPVPRKPRR